MARRNVVEETASDFVESFRTTGLGSASPDWRDTKTASQCLDHLCLSIHLSDVTLRFSKEPSVKLSAHTFVLSMRSRVFEAMFNENKGLLDNTVTIDDIGSETMRVLVRFMYIDKSVIDGKNVLKCLQAAKQYAIAGLVASCSTFLEKNISVENVCTIHEQAIYYKMKELQTKCFEFMVENASDVFKSDGFRRISKATLNSLLKSDNLAEDEENIFTAASTWAEAQCSSNKMDVTPDNKRRCLGESLNEIRFPIMSIENFAKFVTPAGILTSDEQIMLYQYLASQGASPLNKFVARERSGNVVTIDMKKYQNQHICEEGYVLVIQLQPRNLHWNEDGLKLKYVTSKFAANVKEVYSGTSVLGQRTRFNFKVKGDKIIFNPPLHISYSQLTVVFETKASKQIGTLNEYSSISYCSEKVNHTTVSITIIPLGMISISFEK